MDRSCSSGLNGSDLEQMNDKGWRPSLNIVDTWNAYFDSKPVYLQLLNMQTHKSYQNIIYSSMSVTKESNNIYMWNQQKQ